MTIDDNTATPHVSDQQLRSIIGTGIDLYCSEAIRKHDEGSYNAFRNAWTNLIWECMHVNTPDALEGIAVGENYRDMLERSINGYVQTVKQDNPAFIATGLNLASNHDKLVALDIQDKFTAQACNSAVLHFTGIPLEDLEHMLLSTDEQFRIYNGVARDTIVERGASMQISPDTFNTAFTAANNLRSDVVQSGHAMRARFGIGSHSGYCGRG